MPARGGCHCGRVRFEVADPGPSRAIECNCSICSMRAYLHWIVPRERFRLLAGGSALVSYRFNTRTAEHLFCGSCGVESFYVPRSHPDGYSVNLRCLDRGAGGGMAVTAFDGANWEASALPPLGSEDS